MNADETEPILEVKCENCRGDGRSSDGRGKCPFCNGSGHDLTPLGLKVFNLMIHHAHFLRRAMFQEDD